MALAVLSRRWVCGLGGYPFRVLATFALMSALSMTGPPKPYGATPSDRQLSWHAMEYYGFLHFTVNTFTDREWGLGDEPESVFNPTDFDADQIASVAKKAGMKGLILTCKHHDGFCLWPTKTTDHNVSRSPFKKDVVKLMSEACRKHGLKFGVYLSPWDRNNAHYGKPEYLAIYRQQLRELLTQYGPIFEVWHDGANGGDGYYGGARETRKIDQTQYYDWPNTWKLTRDLAPNAVIFSDVGPDVRWVGNENGVAGDPCWATFTPQAPESGRAAAPGFSVADIAQNGTRDGGTWLPAECDVSIRPGWFWHAREDGKVKSPEQLKDLYFKSVGRGANLLLNIPPDRRGQIHPADEKALLGFRKLLDDMEAHKLPRPNTTVSNVRGKDQKFAAQNLFDGSRNTYWATDDAIHEAWVILDYKKPVTFNTVRIREAIQLGQRIESFAIDIMRGGKWEQIVSGQSIGNCRLVQIEPETTQQVRLRITKSAACPCLSELSLFLDPNETP